MKIKSEELLEQIKLCLKDFFVAEVKEKENSLELHFENGQNFRLFLQEN